jgi:hypothetical protein
MLPRIVKTCSAIAALAACASAPAGTHDATPAPSADDDTTQGQEGDDTLDTSTAASPRAGDAGAALVAEVDRELSRMKSSSYSHRTHVDEAAEAFDYDCSGFLVYALSRAAPDALAAVETTTSRRPRSAEFVAFLEGVPADAPRGRWQRIARAADLETGDVIVWLKPADSHSTNTGHTVIVHGAPSMNPEHAGEVLVPIVDSTEGPHGSTDTRAVTHRTGLGQGEIVLVIDASGAPIGYRWSRAKRSREKTTTIVLGRLR